MSQDKKLCPKCGAQMNYHADKLDYTTDLAELDAVEPHFGGMLAEVYTCPECKNIELQRAT